jgi:hypothetical protein
VKRSVHRKHGIEMLSIIFYVLEERIVDHGMTLQELIKMVGN